jgi:hypothetical protein
MFYFLSHLDAFLFSTFSRVRRKFFFLFTRRPVVNYLSTFRDNLSVSYSRFKVGDRTDRLSRNVGKNIYHYLPPYNAEERSSNLLRSGSLKSLFPHCSAATTHLHDRCLPLARSGSPLHLPCPHTWPYIFPIPTIYGKLSIWYVVAKMVYSFGRPYWHIWRRKIRKVSFRIAGAPLKIRNWCLPNIDLDSYCYVNLLR